MRSTRLVFAPLLLALTTIANAAPPADLIPAGAMHVTSVKGVTDFDIAMSAGTVDRFYRKALSAHGWKADDDVSYGTALMFYVRKGKKSFGSVMMTPRIDITHVRLALPE